MPDLLKYLLYSIFAFGMICLAVIASWFFFLILAIGIAASVINQKFFGKKKTTTPEANTFSQGTWNKTTNSNQHEYMTVIDADNTENEYRIPKI
ncbi:MULTISPECIES: hypothetical protein [unclassified Dehalobacter]|uniref:hypothetical protein n=1 Tax=unclassified Dehalobacter TaxID=2635733 RepID=UPI0003733863|nr:MULTISPECIES: hypothetical protein [unclassified Dehalobacter]RJE49023.1 hypothetical protein A7K50_07890 [Dehalobacter sp. MCB1]TCX51763.1 hypothetical protein C1I36_05410 [Dehalobacter sp. 14DCB1]TCX52823.1 hypothetical protein C1I38_07090 [Dehalobacter sp. 12DCB1]